MRGCGDIALAFVLCLALGLVGCGVSLFRAPTIAAPTLPQTAAPTHADDATLDAETRLKNARADLADAQGRVDALTEAARAAQDEQLARQLVWVFLLCLIGFGAAVGAAFWLPVGKKTAASIGGAFLAVGVLALTVRTLIPYLPWIGLALLAIGGAAGLIVLYPHLKTLRELIPLLPDGLGSATAQRVIAAHRRALATATTDRITNKS